jgi:hypothetical protein
LSARRGENGWEEKHDSREGPGGSLPEMMKESAAEFERAASESDEEEIHAQGT